MGCLELLRVLGVLKAARRAKNGIDPDGGTQALIDIAAPLYYSDEVIRDLDDAILSEDALADSASPELFGIRKRMLQENEGIRARLDGIIRSAKHKEHLQDAIVTMRSGRYVVPVKQEHKRSVKGIVHDQSASGQTVFIEPIEVVEANNRLRELELAEAVEIERILHAFSETLRGVWRALRENQKILVRLDVIFARAALASSMKASPPNIAADRSLVIKNGRHPLIDAKSVVPVSLRIDSGRRGLIITGPEHGRQNGDAQADRTAVPDGAVRHVRPRGRRYDAAGVFGAVCGHRRRAEHRAEPQHVFVAHVEHHADTGTRGRRGAGAARRAGRGNGPGRGRGARDGDPRGVRRT